jgi:hypothetical protein
VTPLIFILAISLVLCPILLVLGGSYWWTGFISLAIFGICVGLLIYYWKFILGEDSKEPSQSMSDNQ